MCRRNGGGERAHGEDARRLSGRPRGVLTEEKARLTVYKAQIFFHDRTGRSQLISKKEISKEIKVTVFKVKGETNTDDLSPASDAFTRSDIPLHANCILKSKIKDVYI